MGMNSTLYVINDRLGGIEVEPDLGLKISRAINSSCCYGKEIEVCPGLYIVETHHNDYVKVIGVGGNNAIDLGMTSLGSKEQVLRQIADSMGFVLHRKRAKRGT